MGQQVYHINSIIETPKFENGNIVSVMCIYCYEEILFDIPESRLKLRQFPIQLVSRHGDPEHDLSIEVFENREVKILRKESLQDGPVSPPIQEAEFPAHVEDHPLSEIIPEEKPPITLPPNKTPQSLEVHGYPHLIPGNSEKEPLIPTETQEKQQPSSPNLIRLEGTQAPQPTPSNFREGDQPQARQPIFKLLETEENKAPPQETFVKENPVNDPISRIQTLMQQLPSLSQDEIGKELMQIVLNITATPSRYKLISEIKNWARDVTRMRWDDKQIKFLSHQLKFWIEKLVQSK